MSKKAELIKEMLQMQKKFMELEHKSGVQAEDYFAPKQGHELDGFRQKFQDLANKVVDMAHEEAGSKR